MEFLIDLEGRNQCAKVLKKVLEGNHGSLKEENKDTLISLAYKVIDVSGGETLDLTADEYISILTLKLMYMLGA